MLNLYYKELPTILVNSLGFDFIYSINFYLINLDANLNIADYTDKFSWFLRNTFKIENNVLRVTPLAQQLTCHLRAGCGRISKSTD